jgi:hypothetical protein
MVYCYIRGHESYYANGSWYLVENGQLVTKELIATLPCIRCGQPPSPEGHDACCANTINVRNMCCGHGVEPGYVEYISPTQGV